MEAYKVKHFLLIQKNIYFCERKKTSPTSCNLLFFFFLMLQIQFKKTSFLESTSLHIRSQKRWNDWQHTHIYSRGDTLTFLCSLSTMRSINQRKKSFYYWKTNNNNNKNKYIEYILGYVPKILKYTMYWKTSLFRWNFIILTFI